MSSFVVVEVVAVLLSELARSADGFVNVDVVVVVDSTPTKLPKSASDENLSSGSGEAAIIIIIIT